MRCTIFYSWQSDSASATNRSLIGDALDLAVKAIRSDDSISVEPVIDRDTSGVAGSPEISNTIFRKIENAHIFVGDVTTINPTTKKRKTPNPNVLLELGYAMKALGTDRIVMVLNTASGVPEHLPFDLKLRRIVPYFSQPDDTDRATARKDLAKKLESQLRLILAEVEHAAIVSKRVTAEEDVLQAIRDKRDDRVITAREYLSLFWDRVFALGDPAPTTDEELVQLIERTPAVVVELNGVARTTAVMDDGIVAREIYRSFGRIASRYAVPQGFSGTYRESDFDFYRFAGHELFVTFVAALMHECRWQVLNDLLEEDLALNPRPAFRDLSTTSFNGLSDYTRLLSERSRRTQRISVHADILHERHTTGALADAPPFDQFVAADYFLFLRGEVTQSDAIFTLWRPFSVLYMKRLPELFIRARKNALALHLATALHLPGVDELRALLKQSAIKLQKMFGPFWDGFFAGSDIDEIGKA